MSQDEVAAVEEPRRNGAIARAALPLAVVPLVVLCAAIGKPSLAGVALGGLLAGIYFPDFVRGSTERSVRSVLGSGVVRLIPGAELRGWAARLSVGRFVLIGLLLAAAGLAETASPGWVERFYVEGRGWPWTILTAGGFLAATSVVSVAPAAHHYRRPGPLAVQLFVWVVNLAWFAVGAALITVAIGELLYPGSVSDWVRGMNPFRSP
ncbi:MAG: hypothetical protein R2761_29380 [Acidimicrobiales bacterium]